MSATTLFADQSLEGAVPAALAGVSRDTRRLRSIPSPR